MDVTRAQEIIEANDKIEVVLDGEAVWIDSVNTLSRTAEVHMENNKHIHKNVPTDMLLEK